MKILNASVIVKLDDGTRRIVDVRHEDVMRFIIAEATYNDV